MSPVEKAFLPTERMILVKRQQLLDAAIDYVRNGKDGTMRDRLRTASSTSGISLQQLEAAVGEIDRLRISTK